MARNEYRPRIADKLLQMEILSAGAVLVEGAKWCGKTRTAEQVTHSIVYMQDQDMADNYLQMAETERGPPVNAQVADADAKRAVRHG